MSQTKDEMESQTHTLELHGIPLNDDDAYDIILMVSWNYVNNYPETKALILSKKDIDYTFPLSFGKSKTTFIYISFISLQGLDCPSDRSGWSGPYDIVDYDAEGADGKNYLSSSFDDIAALTVRAFIF